VEETGVEEVSWWGGEGGREVGGAKKR
jgi:hypothetical protein